MKKINKQKPSVTIIILTKQLLYSTAGEKQLITFFVEAHYWPLRSTKIPDTFLFFPSWLNFFGKFSSIFFMSSLYLFKLLQCMFYIQNSS